MRARFVLLGTNHPLQFGASQCPKDKVDAFRTYLTDVCKVNSIKLIAEEASQEALNRYSVGETVAAKLARDEGLLYKMVDLSSDERTQLGIADSQLSCATVQLGSQVNLRPLRDRLTKVSNQVREGTWVARTLQAATWPALLIIGADHVQGVGKLIRALSQKLIVAHADYEP